MAMDRYSKPDGVLDKEIAIRISPRRVLRSSILILLLVSVFYLGRWSVSPPEASVSGFSTGWFGNDAEEDDTPAPKAEPVAKDAPAAAAAKTSSDEEATATAPKNDSNSEDAESSASVITSYTKIALALVDVTSEWKGTYGKITQIKYKIVNNEVGVIKADHFEMIVEGYEEDFVPKKIPLPLSSKTINPGESKEGSVNVPQGFAYSELAAGDLSSVKITLKLIDGNEKTMATYEKQVALKSQ